ncbi:unnamed protein product [Brachionus calyciflorus]|uniref:Uncharacterized protein n=1 Tax=Brachionus calyciflorus TaxID=104777 RepID=A0A814JQD9_9BILA|nr:unnamed protein product [Brachionus calyciflorus]
MEPYGTCQMKFDQDKEEHNEDKYCNQARKPNNEQASKYLKVKFTSTKHILNDQPIRQDALIKVSDSHLVKSEPIEIEEQSEKKQKLIIGQLMIVFIFLKTI